LDNPTYFGQAVELGSYSSGVLSSVALLPLGLSQLFHAASTSQSCLCRQASPWLSIYYGRTASAEFPAFAGKTTEFKTQNNL